MVKVFWFNHLCMGYRLGLYRKVQAQEGLQVSYFFDHDRSGQARTLLDARVGPTLQVPLRASGRAIDVYLSLGLLASVLWRRPDVIVSEDGGNISNNICLALLKPLIGYRLILWGLGEIPERQPSLLKKLAWPAVRWTWRRADAIVSYSNFGRDVYLREGVSPGAVRVAFNAVDFGPVAERIRTYRQHSSLSEKLGSRRLVLYAGRLVATKRPDDFLEVARCFWEQGERNYWFVIVGDGEARPELEARVRSLGLGNCWFAGPRSMDALSEFFAFAAICVVPGEGGLVVNQSLAHGVPVMISSGDGTERDLIREGRNGKFFKRGDIAGICSGIREIAGSPEYSAGAAATRLPTETSAAEVFLEAISAAPGGEGTEFGAKNLKEGV